jgi:hypothetical protein
MIGRYSHYGRQRLSLLSAPKGGEERVQEAPLPPEIGIAA